MTNLELRRRLNSMSAQVNWRKQQQSIPVAPKVAPVIKKVAEVKKEEIPVAPAPAPEPVVEPPVETVATPIEEEPTFSTDEIRGWGDNELVKHWECVQKEENRAAFEREIFRRAKKHARKIKVELPEDKCEGDNVNGFINVLFMEPPAVEQ